MQRYLVALDQGTTGSTALIVSPEGELLAKANLEYTQHYPKPGWVEHDPEDWWRSTLEALAQAQRKAGVEPAGCIAVGITNQRETTVIWDRKTGEAQGHAIVWQDRRTAEFCSVLKTRGFGEELRARAGLVVDPYFSGTKVAWMLRHRSLQARADKGELAFGTVDAYLVYRLSGGERHATDASNAARTMLFNIHERRWDETLCEALGVPQALLPEVVPSSGLIATTRGIPGLPDGTPITGMAGDQNAALFGQRCFEVGEAKCTYGTGAFLLMNAGPSPRPSAHKLLSTIGWQIGDEVSYALEGSAFVAGAAVQWLRDGLGILKQSSDIEALAAQVVSTDGVHFVPALAGLGAPHWVPEARGLLHGLTRGTTQAHIARAVLEGIAWQIVDLAEAMALDAGASLKLLRVDGGAAQNDLLMQMQSDFLRAEVERPQCVETTALGAAYLAGLGAGVWPNKEALLALNPPDARFSPVIGEGHREEASRAWQNAVAAAARL